MNLMTLSNIIRLIDWQTLANIAVVITAVFVIWQLREMQRTTVAQAFWPVIEILQDEKVREARKTLLTINEPDFTKWTEGQRNKAELACTTYDILGIFLRRTKIDLKFVTSEWRHSVIKCWEHARPMTIAYQRDRGKDFGDDFEWLHNHAVTSNKK